MWIWALIFIESLVRLSLSLEKRNKEGQSGPRDHEDEASLSLPEFSRSRMTPTWQVVGHTTMRQAPTQRCLAITWAALFKDIY